MADNQPPKDTASPPQEVDRIRDMIFGPQMRTYEQRFDTIRRDLERLQQELDRLTEQAADQRRDHDKNLQALRREARQADDDVRSELRATTERLTDDKVDRLALGELFIELGNQLKTGGSLADMLKTLGQVK